MELLYLKVIYCLYSEGSKVDCALEAMRMSLNAINQSGLSQCANDQTTNWPFWGAIRCAHDNNEKKAIQQRKIYVHPSRYTTSSHLSSLRDLAPDDAHFTSIYLWRDQRLAAED